MATEASDAATVADQPAQTQRPEALSTKTLLLSLALLIVGLIWTRQAEMVSHGAQITESVPVIPAVAALIFLAALAPLLRRLPSWLRLSQAQVLTVYVFLCVATSMSSVGVVRMLFPEITALVYFETPENEFDRYAKLQPSWLTVQDREVVRQMYEGEAQERIPWRHWLRPLAWWMLLYAALFGAMLFLMVILRRQWADKERLTFPVVHLVVEVSQQPRQGLLLPLLRNPLMWVGFGTSALYNVLNILNAYNPSVPALGRYYDIGSLFTERPWSAVRPLSIAYRPELLGLGYLVSLEVLLSVWVFYLVTRLENVFAVMVGYEVAGFPFDREQATGAYLALAIFLLYVARGHLAEVFRKAFRGLRSLDDSAEPAPYSVAVWGFVVSFGLVLVFATRAGMALWTAAVYFSLIIGFAMVYARARAEAGAAMVWLFPFYEHKKQMLNFLGSRAFSRGGDWRNLTIFSMFMMFSRGYFQSMMGYQAESFKIAELANIRQRSITWVLMLALVIGLAGAYYIHLECYYKFGNNVLEGGDTEGGYRTRLVKSEYEELSSFSIAHKPPDRARSALVGVGFLVTTALVGLRALFLRFPLHPLGYAMVMSYGHPLWGPFLVCWMAKTIILKLGGMRLYRRLIPVFLGIVLGHFFTAGIVWGTVSIIGEMYKRYIVHFG